MVLEFQKQKQKQKMLIGVLVGVVLVAAVVIWYGFFQPEPVVPVVETGGFSGAKNINIDFDTLESQKLKDMDIFIEIPPFSGEIGKPDIFKLTGGFKTGELTNQENATENVNPIVPPQR